MNMEQISNIIFLSVFAVPGVIFGLVLCTGRGADLIAGYNTASPAEKAKWNEKALCRAVGILLLLMVGCIELSCLGAVLNVVALTWVSLFLTAVLTVAGLLYINKSKRFRREDLDKA